MHKAHLMSGGRYPVLRSLAILYLIGAGVLALLGLATIIWALVRGPGDVGDRLIIAAGALAATFILVLSTLAVAEVLKLFIDVEHNTRMAAMGTTVVSTTGAAVVETGADGGRVNRMSALDEETAEAALLRGR